MEGRPEPGDTLALVSAHGEFLAQVAYSPASQIRARVLSYVESERIDENFFAARLRTALARRDALFASGVSDAARLVHAESDHLPGLVVDRYADTLVLQILSAGMERWRDEIARALAALTGCTRVYERSDVEVRQLEGLAARAGPLIGAAPLAPIEIHEHGLRYLVDIVHGQKTGFYLDQRDNRRRAMALARGRSVLNAFCYSGGFTLAALAGGAGDTLSIDSSAGALALGAQNAARNGFAAERAQWLEADVFKALRELRDRGQRFDLIVLDPPKFAPTAAHAEKAARAYKDINLLALKLLAPEGVLMTFSCSGGVSAELFQKIVAGAAADAQLEAYVLERLAAAPDHPVAIHFPEGEYLKGLVLQRA